MVKSRKNTIRYRRELFKDIFFIFVGALITVFLSKFGIIDLLIRVLGGNVIATFIAGIFFTSVFTLAPASVALAHMSTLMPTSQVLIFGALGAMTGDLLLFYFIRDRFADDLLGSMRPSVVKHVFRSFHFGFLKWLSPLLGAAFIASPLPDEFGLMLMGISKIRVAVLLPISFAMNILGVYSIIWFAHLV